MDKKKLVSLEHKELVQALKSKDLDKLGPLFKELGLVSAILNDAGTAALVEMRTPETRSDPSALSSPSSSSTSTSATTNPQSAPIMNPEIAAQEAEMKKLEKDLEENSNGIKKTADEIEKLSVKIEKFEPSELEGKLNEQQQNALNGWREKEKDLRDKEKLLLEEKIKLLDKEKRLNEKLDNLKAKEEAEHDSKRRKLDPSEEVRLALGEKSLPEIVDYFWGKLDKSWVRKDRGLQPDPFILAKKDELNPELKFLHREETFKAILGSFESVLARESDVKKGPICLAGGRGTGKTRALYELCVSGKGDSYMKQMIAESDGLYPEVTKEIDKFLFIPITFNNETAHSGQGFENDPPTAAGARFFYSYFCAGERVEWAAFSQFFDSYSSFLSLNVVLQMIWDDVKSLGRYTNIVLLIDESRAAIEKVSKGRSDLADNLSQLQLKNNDAAAEEKLAEVTVENVLFNKLMSGLYNERNRFSHTLHIVVTSLSFQLFRNYETLSAHPLYFAPLPPLTDDNVKELGRPILDQIRGSNAKNAQEAELLLLGSNGYPRLVAIFSRVLHRVHRASSTFHGNFLTQLLNLLSSQFQKSFFLDYLKSSELRRAIVLSIIGNVCKFSHLQPLISIGLLFPSDMSEKFTPKMPSLVLWYLASQPGLAEVVREKDNSSDTLAVAILLRHCLEIVSVGSLGVGKRFEYKVEHMIRARVLSYYLFQKGDTAVSEAKNEDRDPTALSRGEFTLTLRKLFRLEDTQFTAFPNEKDGATACKSAFSDLSFVFPALLETGTFKDNVPKFSKPPLVSKLLFPTEDTNPGFDLLIEGVTSEKKHYVVAVQMKESAEGSTKVLGKPDIADMLVKTVEYHDWVANFINADCFRLLVIPRRSISEELRKEEVFFGAVDSIIQSKAVAKEGEKKRLISAKVANAASKAVSSTILLRKEGINSFFTPTFSHSS